MKITKKQAVKASDELLVTPDEIALVDVPATADPIPSEECCCTYQCAVDFISSAIECLAEIAKDDQIAKDSIANLGVVMLDLKGGC